MRGQLPRSRRDDDEDQRQRTALIRVSNDRQTPARARNHLDQIILHRIRVLKLVDQDALNLGDDAGVALEELVASEEEVVEVECVCFR